MFLPVQGVPGGKAASAAQWEQTHAVPTELATRETDAKSSRRWTCRCWPKSRGQAHGGTKARSRVFLPQCLSLPAVLSPCCLMLL